ncbi:excalibur calcium-binding domain-containing protein [uncultured Aquimarina sp.]|uniref:excalibur calcium-binding domain-containing protein n=1 Tax=uncultured Aquimarina sp. TaxID=575652 RepID=UPI00260AAA73|nr:excalibur calcium-binding domain-containing protein [uncultured Aquimarina sp.]
MQHIKTLFSILSMLMFISLISSCSESETELDTSSGCRDTNCANYTSMASAQTAFDADPECRNDLDRDNDGIACEEPGNSVRTCASTSNCGCSNKPKSQCESDPCCKWVVGTGCKCS